MIPREDMAAGHLSIFKPPLHGLWTKAHQMSQLAKRQTLLFTQCGDVTDAASRIASNVINGPEGGFRLSGGLSIRGGLGRIHRHG